MDMATGLFGIGSASSTIYEGTWQELCPLIPWVTGLPNLLLVVDPEVAHDPAPASLICSPVADLDIHAPPGNTLICAPKGRPIDLSPNAYLETVLWLSFSSAQSWSGAVFLAQGPSWRYSHSGLWKQAHWPWSYCRSWLGGSAQETMWLSSSLFHIVQE